MNRREVMILLVIVAAGAFLRSWNLESIPRWDWDEGVNLDIATNLAAGKMQWACLTYPFVPHPPLFFMLVASAVRLFGSALLVERAVTAFCGVATAVFVYFIARRFFSTKAAFFAGLLYAIYPAAIYFSRIGFANNLLTLLLTSCMYFLVRYLDEKKSLWLLLSAAAAGLSTITEIQGFCTVAALLIVLWFCARKDMLKAAAVSLLFFAVFAVVMVNIMHDAFLADAFYSTGRFNPLAAGIAVLLVVFFVYRPLKLERLRRIIFGIYGPIFEMIKENPVSYIILFIFASLIAAIPPSDELFFIGFDYHWLGVVGLLLMKDAKPKTVLSVFFLAYFIALLGFDRADHMLMPLYPMLALGLGYLFDRFLDFSASFFGSVKETCGSALFLSVLIIAAPLLAMSYYDVDMFLNGKWIGVEDAHARDAVAAYLNANTAEGDVVIVDSHLTRMVTAKPNVLIQAVAYDGHAVEFIRPDYGRNRFLADCSYRNAKFIVLGNGTLEEISNQSAFGDLVDGISGWSSRDVGGFVVYENPAGVQ